MKPLLTAPLRVIKFQLTRDEFNTWGAKHLLYGMLLAWLAGIGRYWDNPRADLWQHLGLGSVAYVFVLGLFLFLFLWPLLPQNWNYARLVTFIAFTSPLAYLYALPVEMWMPLKYAAISNVAFLAVVAFWRVIAFGTFLVRVAQLSFFRAFVGMTVPLAGIVAALYALNLEHAVFNLMAGLHDTEATSVDGAFMVIFLLTAVSYYGAPFLILLYLIAIASASRAADKRAEAEGAKARAAAENQDEN
jgi:hypothetical protein